MPAANTMSDGMIPDGSPVAASLEALLAEKTCRKCYHLVKNGMKSGNIHSTLAYAKCRCHRNWKYLMPAPSLPEHLQANRIASARRRNPVPRPTMSPGSPYSARELTGGTGKPIQPQNRPSVAPSVRQPQQAERKPQAVVTDKLPVLNKCSLVLQSSNCSLTGVDCSSSISESKLATGPASSSSKSDVTNSAENEPSLDGLKLSPAHSGVRLSPKPSSSIKMPQITRLVYTFPHMYACMWTCL